MTQTEYEALMVERYQPRHLARDGAEMPKVLTFDEFLASLRAEAKKPVPSEPAGYAKTRAETIRWQNEEADAFIARRVEREKELERIRRHDAGRRKKTTVKKTTAVKLSQADAVAVSLLKGQSLREALQEANKRGNS